MRVVSPNAGAGRTASSRRLPLGRFFGHRNLGAERLQSPLGKAMQRVVIEPVFQLRRRHVQRVPVQGCDKDKRSDKQTNIEMEATQQVQPCRAQVQVVILFLF